MMERYGRRQPCVLVGFAWICSSLLWAMAVRMGSVHSGHEYLDTGHTSGGEGVRWNSRLVLYVELRFLDHLLTPAVLPDRLSTSFGFFCPLLGSQYYTTFQTTL